MKDKEDLIRFGLPIVNRAGLPHYPAPDVDGLLDRFLQWVRPLVTDGEYGEAVRKVRDLRENPAYPAICQKMEELGNRENDSWIFDYWVRFHLLVRDPLAPYTNVPVAYENDMIKDLPLADKAAATLWAAAKVYLDFRRAGNGGYPVGKKTCSNDQFWGALASMNHIRRGGDRFYISEEVSRHAVILRRNRAYKIPVSAGGWEPLPWAALRDAVAELLAEDREPLTPGVNFATAQPDRDKAGDLLAALLELPENREAYQALRDAVLVLNLDDDQPEGVLDTLYWACMDRGCFNRWHGKGTQFSIAANGAMSMIVDHSFCDGGTEAFLAEGMRRALEGLDLSAAPDPAAREECAVQELGFRVPERLAQDLLDSLAAYRGRMDAYRGEVVELPQLTRQGLRDRGVLSGDGFLHIALQAAQQMTWGAVYNTYISVDCRMFFRGRTEVNRPITPESLAFVRALTQGGTGREELRRLLDRALDAHHRRTKECQAGLGVNRRLYVLEQVCRQYAGELGLAELPALFSDRAYGVMGESRLSTTSFGSRDMKYVYFPPVMEHGVGVFYQVGERSFLINTMFKEDGDTLERFDQNLREAVTKMLEL